MKTLNNIERRKERETKILHLFSIAKDMAQTRENGIGKYTIKRSLMFNDSELRISINTIKRIVDDLVVRGVIECSNTENKSALKFKLREVKDD